MGLKVHTDGDDEYSEEEEEEELEDELERQNIDPDIPGNPIMQGSLNLGA